MLPHLDRYRAFMPYPSVEVAGAPDGPLRGLRLAVKDLYDVAGYRTGCGSPIKLAQSEVKTSHAPVVARLLSAGAEFCGKTHTDELAWSLYGVNAHFGTPVNPAAPDHIPGGSSSGSAAAVAGRLADIALGSDTGGSVRAPASFCGIWGIRPTHGRLSLEGCMPLAPSWDTCGFFARDGDTLERVGRVLFDTDKRPLSSPRLMVPQDMIDGVNEAGAALIENAIRHIEKRRGELPRVFVYEGRREAIYTAFREIQAVEVLGVHGEWERTFHPPLGPGIAERFDYARAVTAAQLEAANRHRAELRAHMEALLGDDGILVAPAVHNAPLRLDAAPAAFDSYRHDAMKLLCVSGHCGLPQVVFPLGQVGGAPFGLSLIGPRGSDLGLVAVAREISAIVA